MAEPPRPLSCQDARRAIQEVLGGTGLDEDTTRHLLGCQACRREAESVARLVGGLRLLPMAEPSQDFWERLPGRIVDQVHAVKRRHAWALSALTAAALLLFAIFPTERARRSAGPWWSEVLATDSRLDPLGGVRSGDEAARVVRRVAVAQDFGPRAIQRMIEVTEEETVRRPETVAWNLLDTLGPQELEQVVLRLEKGVGR